MENERIEFLQSVKVTKLCEKCGGNMVFSGRVLTTYPGKYPHNCKECNHEQNYDRSYPAVQYRNVNDSTLS